MHGDGGENPLSTIFASPAAFQYIRALPCAAGGLIAFTHRLLHWGSAADPHAQGAAASPRVALSFACAAPEFEQCYLQPRETHLPFPEHQARLGLLAGNLLAYGQNEDPGPAMTELLWGEFLKVVNAFDPQFVRRVHAARAWLLARHSAARIESVGGNA